LSEISRAAFTLFVVATRFSVSHHAIFGGLPQRCTVSANTAARKRAEKSARRKKQLAERRKAEIAEIGIGNRGRMRQLTAPIHRCLLQKGSLVAGGAGLLILARKLGGGIVTMSVFMLDSYCLGAKNAFLVERNSEEADWIIDSLMASATAVPVEPGYARKLLHGLVAWSRSLGIEPHKDYAAAEALFGDISSEGYEIEFSFGLEGKPMLVAGPEDTPAQLRRWRERLSRTLGADGFEWMEALDDDDEDEFGEDEWDEDVEPLDPAEFEARAGLYDPDRAPDPKEWLALGEEERLMRIEAYHRLAHIPSPDGALHALFHIAVENRIAEGDETPVQSTVARLMSEGLDRHQALHAVASKLAEQQLTVAKSGGKSGYSPEAYFAAIQTLTAESWRREMEAYEDGTVSCVPASLLRREQP
jgi:hypothetical protein